MTIELKNIDDKETAEVVDASTTEPEKVEIPEVENKVEEKVVEPAVVEKEPEHVEEPAKIEPIVDPIEGQEEKQPEPKVEIPKKSKATKRIENLVQDKKKLEARIEEFKNAKLPELQKEEIDVNDLNSAINNKAIESAKLMHEQAKLDGAIADQNKAWVEDFDGVLEKHPQLNPDSKEFDQELEKTISNLVLDDEGKLRPHILVSDLMEKFVSRENAVKEQAIEEGKNGAEIKIAKQIAESAVTPGSQPVSTEDKTSDEEMAKLRTDDPKEFFKRL